MFDENGRVLCCHCTSVMRIVRKNRAEAVFRCTSPECNRIVAFSFNRSNLPMIAQAM
jgi:hypothetical protein